LVAVTLPTDVVQDLRARDADLARAIVGLVERRRRPDAVAAAPRSDVELAAIGGRQSLIVVNRSTFHRLPGVNIVPLAGNRAFLALKSGLGLADLELAVADRLEDGTGAAAERKALASLRNQLREWRRDRSLRFHSRAIIVVERRGRRN
jgi:hypothetical protein